MSNRYGFANRIEDLEAQHVTDQEVIAILSRRHVVVLDELEHARRLAVLLEQERAAETASWRRNPTMIEFQRRGIGVYDGPGTCSWCSRWEPTQDNPCVYCGRVGAEG